MNSIKRAGITMRRQLGKSLILFFLVLILSSIMAGAIVVTQAIANTEASLLRRIPAITTLVFDWNIIEEFESTMEESEYTSTTSFLDILLQIADFPSVSYYDFSTHHRLHSREINLFLEELNLDRDLNWEWFVSIPEFEVHGVQNSDFIYLQAGIIEMSMGRTFLTEELINSNESFVAIISRELAESNNLTIGSTFFLDNVFWDWDILDENSATYGRFLLTEDAMLIYESYELEVIGIFEIIEEVNMMDDWENETTNHLLQNRIYVPNLMIEHARYFWFITEQELYPEWNEGRSFEDFLDGRLQPVYFVLHDVTYLSEFITEANVLLQPFGWEARDSSDAFSELTNILVYMDWFASIILGVSTGATILVLSLLLMLFLRDRRYEIGVYLAIGEKRRNVLIQILFEVIPISIIAIIFSLMIGTYVGNEISLSMVRTELTPDYHRFRDWTNPVPRELHWFAPDYMPPEEMIELYDVSLTPTTVVLFYGVGMSIILVSTALPVIYVMRLKPKKILL